LRVSMNKCDVCAVRPLSVPPPHHTTAAHAATWHAQAVENHMPEVIIVDEIGTRGEADAAESIAARGVALVATAHGTCLGDLIKNGHLAALVGGVHSVLLSADEAAARRVTRKTVRERKQAPVFAAAVELRGPHEFIVHPSVEAAVDGYLDMAQPAAQRRTRSRDGEMRVEDVPARNPLIGGALRTED
jgi:hypothetical protein